MTSNTPDHDLSGPGGRRAGDSLKVRGVVTCVLLLVLLVGTAGVFGELIRQREAYARLINMSGRQRMLSQRIALASAWLAADPGDERARSTLDESIGDMERAHEVLAHGVDNPTPLSPALQAHYFEGDGALDPMLAGYLARARRVRAGEHDEAAALRPLAASELLERLDRAVALYEEESVESLQELARVFYGLLVVSVLVLVVVGLLVIRPLVLEVAARVRQLETAAVDLADSNMMLEERVATRTAELAGALEQRTQLLRELHHRVKNNLQIVSSLLRLQMARAQDEGVREGLMVTQRRIDALARLHRTLHDGGDVSSLDLGVYLSELVGSGVAGLGPDDVALTVEVVSVPVSPDTATPCGLLVNELVTNAIKYGRGEDGRLHLSVSLEERGEDVVLEVADRGPGFEDDDAVGSSGSLGLQIVRNLAAQLEGTLEFESRGGARVTLRFALPPTPEPSRSS